MTFFNAQQQFMDAYFLGDSTLLDIITTATGLSIIEQMVAVLAATGYEPEEIDQFAVQPIKTIEVIKKIKHLQITQKNGEFTKLY